MLNINFNNIYLIKQYQKSEIQLWDLSGKKSLQKLWEKYFDELDALVYIIDITASNLNNSIFTLSNKNFNIYIFNIIDSVLKNELIIKSNAPTLILLNKIDLVEKI